MVCRGASATIPEETFIAPISVPSALPRLYYLFRKPITLSPEDLESDDKCQKVYLQVCFELSARQHFNLKNASQETQLVRLDFSRFVESTFLET